MTAEWWPWCRYSPVSLPIITHHYPSLPVTVTALQYPAKKEFSGVAINWVCYPSLTVTTHHYPLVTLTVPALPGADGV